MNSYGQEWESFRVLFLYESEYLRRFSNLHWCTFNLGDYEKQRKAKMNVATTNLVI